MCLHTPHLPKVVCLRSVCLAGVPAAATQHVVHFDAATCKTNQLVCKALDPDSFAGIPQLAAPCAAMHTHTYAPVHVPCAGLQPRLQAGALAAAITVPVVATLLAATLLLLWWHKRQRHASKAADAVSNREHSHAVLLTGAEEGHTPKQVPTGLLIGRTSVQCCRQSRHAMSASNTGSLSRHFLCNCTTHHHSALSSCLVARNHADMLPLVCCRRLAQATPSQLGRWHRAGRAKHAHQHHPP